SPLSIQFEYVAVFDQNNVLFSVAEMVLDEFFVTKQHAIFTVNRHDELWPHRFSHDANVVLRSVAADMNQATLLFDDVSTALVDETDQFRDRALVAGKDAR